LTPGLSEQRNGQAGRLSGHRILLVAVALFGLLAVTAPWWLAAALAAIAAFHPEYAGCFGCHV